MLILGGVLVRGEANREKGVGMEPDESKRQRHLHMHGGLATDHVLIRDTRRHLRDVEEGATRT